MTPDRNNATNWAATGTARLAGVAIFAAMAGFAAVYGTFGGKDKVETRLPSAAPAAFADANPAVPGTGAARNGNPLATGEMTAFVFKKSPEDLPEITFANGAGKALTLGDFKGKTVLLNLWATWCAPCRKEMPALDRLQKELGSDSFEVLALSVDRSGADGSKKFLDGIKVEHLKLYVDASARSATTLKAVGMPTTILIGKDGREIGRLVGPAEWDSADAKRLIAASVK